MPWRYALVFIGVFCSSTAVIMIRMSHTHPTVLAALRLLIASVLLAPVFWREMRRHRGVYTRQHWQRSLWPSVMLAVHFISWGYGSRMTFAAQASLIANLVPIALPFFLHWLVAERINRTEILGTAIALGGVAVLPLLLPDAFQPSAGGVNYKFNRARFGVTFSVIISVTGNLAKTRHGQLTAQLQGFRGKNDMAFTLDISDGLRQRIAGQITGDYRFGL